MQSLSFELLEQIESFKHKLTDIEYKTIVEKLSNVNKEEKKIEEKKNEKEYEITYLKITAQQKNPYVDRGQQVVPHSIRYYFETQVEKVKLKLSLDFLHTLQNRLFLSMNYFIWDYNTENYYSLNRDIISSGQENYVYENDEHENVLIQDCKLILLKVEPVIE